MRLFLAVLLLVWPALGSAQARLSPEDAAVLQAGLVVTADEFVLPAYAAQADASAGLVDSLTAYCTGAGDIAAVHDGFAETFLAWQRSSVIQMGPVMAAEGPMRVQLWPDPKGFSQRAIRAAIRTEDPALLAPGGLEGRSIALTNLTALEALVYPDLPTGTYACDLATAIAVFQRDLAAGLVDAWTPGSAYRADFDTAMDGTGRYASVEDVLRDMLAGAVVYVDRLRKFKILRGLGETAGEARSERTEAVDSGLGLQSLQVAFQTLADFYETPYGVFDAAPDIGGSMDYYMLGEGALSAAEDLALQSASLVEIADADGPEAQALRRMADLVLFHESFLKTGFTDSIGLTAGFTAADGD